MASNSAWWRADGQVFPGAEVRDHPQPEGGLHRRRRLLSFHFMTTTTLTDSEKRERLKELMDDFDTAMLVTRTEDGGLRSRPLSIAHNDDDQERLYFSTAIDSPKVRELETDPSVNVCMQNKRRFVSVTGLSRLVKDRALINKLWSETWRIWFPKGKDDPSLCILIVEPSEAAYWDASGLEGVTYLFEMAKAYVMGTKAASDDDERHVARVKL
jgi:general stress protein 26